MHYGLELNIFNPFTNKWHEGIEYTGSMLDMDLHDQMRALSDVHILEMLLGRVPTEEEIKALQELSINVE
jgi:hypothetical protein